MLVKTWTFGFRFWMDVFFHSRSGQNSAANFSADLEVDLEQFEQRSLVDDENSLPQILEGFYTTPNAPTDAPLATN